MWHDRDLVQGELWKTDINDAPERERRVPLWDEMEQCFASPEIAALVIK